MTSDIDIHPSAIAAKSDQINADDLKSAPIVARIVRVTESDGQADKEKQPYQVYLEGIKHPWRPCKTMIRLLVEMWGIQAVNKNWAGHTIKLVRDPEVCFGRDKTGGIRLTAADIERRFTCLLPVSRGKRATFIVDPLPISRENKPEPVSLESLLTNAGKTIADLDAFRAIQDPPKLPVGQLPPDQQAKLADYYQRSPAKLAEIPHLETPTTDAVTEQA